MSGLLLKKDLQNLEFSRFNVVLFFSSIIYFISRGEQIRLHTIQCQSHSSLNYGPFLNQQYFL